MDTNGAYTTGCFKTTSGGTCAPTHGIVPWVNLGLSKNDVIDAFGYYIDYVPSVGLNTNSTSMQRLAPASYPTSANLVVKDAASPTQNVQTSAAAYVLISHGPDGSGGYSGNNGTIKNDPNGSAQPDSDALQGANIAGSLLAYFVQNTPLSVAAPGGYFDDIVRFRTAPLIIQLCGSNACGNPA